MKKLTICVILFFVQLCFFSCSDSGSEYILENNTFSFIARNIVCDLNQITYEFEISATRDETGKVYNHRVEVYTPQTSAVIGEQVILPEDLSFNFGKKEKTQTLTLKLNPAKINETIQLTLVSFIIPSQKEHHRYNDTITVKLLPVIKDI